MASMRDSFLKVLCLQAIHNKYTPYTHASNHNYIALLMMLKKKTCPSIDLVLSLLLTCFTKVARGIHATLTIADNIKA